jgi:hypothetical protein
MILRGLRSIGISPSLIFRDLRKGVLQGGLMPYRRAHYYVAILIFLTFPAFWWSYFSKLGTVQWQFHVHGATAGAWMVLLVAQSWTIHNGRRDLHKSTGLATLILLPLFLAGSSLVIAAMASGDGAFRQMFGARLALFDIIASLAFSGFVYGALRNLRNVALHARYMMATPFLLFTPVASRLLSIFVPGLTIRAVEEIPRFGYALQLSQVLVIITALWLWSRNRKAGRPFLLLTAVAVLQSLSFETVGATSAWQAVSVSFGAISPATAFLVGITFGAVVCLLGWRRPPPPPPILTN